MLPGACVCPEIAVRKVGTGVVAQADLVVVDLDRVASGSIRNHAGGGKVDAGLVHALHFDTHRGSRRG